jgi:hypothetical protein
MLGWGRVGDPVDEARYLARLRRVLPNWGFEQITDIALCAELAEVREHRYFFEAIISIAAQFAEMSRDRLSFQKRLAEDDVAFSKSLYLLGTPRSASAGCPACGHHAHNAGSVAAP